MKNLIILPVLLAVSCGQTPVEETAATPKVYSMNIDLLTHEQPANTTMVFYIANDSEVSAYDSNKNLLSNSLKSDSESGMRINNYSGVIKGLVGINRENTDNALNYIPALDIQFNAPALTQSKYTINYNSADSLIYDGGKSVMSSIISTDDIINEPSNNNVFRGQAIYSLTSAYDCYPIGSSSLNRGIDPILLDVDAKATAVTANSGGIWTNTTDGNIAFMLKPAVNKGVNHCFGYLGYTGSNGYYLRMSAGSLTNNGYVSKPSNISFDVRKAVALKVNDTEYFYGLSDNGDVKVISFDTTPQDLYAETGTLITGDKFTEVKTVSTDITSIKLLGDYIIGTNATDINIYNTDMELLGSKNVCTNPKVNGYSNNIYSISCDDKVLFTDNQLNTLYELDVTNSVGSILVYKNN